MKKVPHGFQTRKPPLTKVSSWGAGDTPQNFSERKRRKKLTHWTETKSTTGTNWYL